MLCKNVAVIDNREIAPGVFSMTVPWEERVLPGQFFMLKVPHGTVLLPRAISICDWEEGTLRFVYQVVGRGTRDLSRLLAGEKIQLTGPLGNGFPLENLTGPIALVGGGIGTAPLFYTAKRMREAGLTTDGYFGFRDAPFLTEELTPFLNRVEIASESGRYGTKGYVTEIFRPEDYKAVLCCGPEPMMKAVATLCEKAGVPVYVSMENKMACGVGGCLVCTCTDKLGKNRRACKDGPVFRGEEIHFDA